MPTFNKFDLVKYLERSSEILALDGNFDFDFESKSYASKCKCETPESGGFYFLDFGQKEIFVPNRYYITFALEMKTSFDCSNYCESDMGNFIKIYEFLYECKLDSKVYPIGDLNLDRGGYWDFGVNKGGSIGNSTGRIDCIMHQKVYSEKHTHLFDIQLVYDLKKKTFVYLKTTLDGILTEFNSDDLNPQAIYYLNIKYDDTYTPLSAILTNHISKSFKDCIDPMLCKIKQTCSSKKMLNRIYDYLLERLSQEQVSLVKSHCERVINKKYREGCILLDVQHYYQCFNKCDDTYPLLYHLFNQLLKNPPPVEPVVEVNEHSRLNSIYNIYSYFKSFFTWTDDYQLFMTGNDEAEEEVNTRSSFLIDGFKLC
jgi:hypothetical protein